MRAPWPCLPALVGLALLSACGGEDAPPPEAPPPAPVLGTWEMDREALIDSFLQMAFAELEDGRATGLVSEEAYHSLAAEIRQQTTEKFGMMRARFVFADNGTFEADGSNGTASGTWVLKGPALDIAITRQDGAALFEPIRWAARFEDGVITLHPEEDKDYVMTLRRGG